MTPKTGFLAFCATLSFCLVSQTSEARDEIARGIVNEKPVILFGDGFWRYDDQVGEICTVVRKQGSVCALPSVWSRLPDVDEMRYGLPEFVQGEFTAEFAALTPLGDENLGIEQLSAYLDKRVRYDGLLGTVLATEEAKLGSFEGGLLAFSMGSKGVAAFTYAFQNGRILIAKTLDQNTTLFDSRHRAAHQSFVDAIVPSEFR